MLHDLDGPPSGSGFNGFDGVIDQIFQYSHQLIVLSGDEVVRALENQTVTEVITEASASDIGGDQLVYRC